MFGRNSGSWGKLAGTSMGENARKTRAKTASAKVFRHTIWSLSDSKWRHFPARIAVVNCDEVRLPLPNNGIIRLQN